METEPFGTSLRRAREQRQLTLRQVAGATKIPCATLEQLEEGNLDDLPAEVFVRGFIRSYARAVGADETPPLHDFARALAARRAAERALSATPVVDPTMAAADDDASTSRRSLGLAVFVIILLLIATITLSLLLRRPPFIRGHLAGFISAFHPARGLVALPPWPPCRRRRSCCERSTTARPTVW